jgi:hypothetical protein
MPSTTTLPNLQVRLAGVAEPALVGDLEDLPPEAVQQRR